MATYIRKLKSSGNTILPVTQMEAIALSLGVLSNYIITGEQVFTNQVYDQSQGCFIFLHSAEFEKFSPSSLGYGIMTYKYSPVDHYYVSTIIVITEIGNYFYTDNSTITSFGQLLDKSRYREWQTPQH